MVWAMTWKFRSPGWATEKILRTLVLPAAGSTRPPSRAGDPVQADEGQHPQPMVRQVEVGVEAADHPAGWSLSRRACTASRHAESRASSMTPAVWVSDIALMSRASSASISWWNMSNASSTCQAHGETAQRRHPLTLIVPPLWVLSFQQLHARGSMGDTITTASTRSWCAGDRRRSAGSTTSNGGSADAASLQRIRVGSGSRRSPTPAPTGRRDRVRRPPAGRHRSRWSPGRSRRTADRRARPGARRRRARHLLLVDDAEAADAAALDGVLLNGGRG